MSLATEPYTEPCRRPSLPDDALSTKQEPGSSLPLSQPPEGLTARSARAGSWIQIQGNLEGYLRSTCKIQQEPKGVVCPVIPQEADPDYFP